LFSTLPSSYFLTCLALRQTCSLTTPNLFDHSWHKNKRVVSFYGVNATCTSRNQIVQVGTVEPLPRIVLEFWLGEPIHQSTADIFLTWRRLSVSRGLSLSSEIVIYSVRREYTRILAQQRFLSTLLLCNASYHICHFLPKLGI
jgi:hypothetical protein